MTPNEPNLVRTPSPAPTPVVSAPAGLPSTGDTMRTSVFLPAMLPGMEQGPQLPSALNSAPTAFTLFRAFQRRWPLALSAGLLAGILTAIAISFLFPARFVTYYRVKINSASEGVAIGDPKNDPDFRIFTATQAALAKSRPVVVRGLESQANGKYIKDLAIIRNSSDAIDWLQTSIKTDFLQAPEIMTVTLAGDYAEDLTLLLNALAKSLIEENRLVAESKHLGLIEQTQARARQLQNDLDLKRKLFNQRSSAMGPTAASAGRKLEQMEQDLRDARKALRDKQSDIAGVRSRIDQMTRRIQNPDAFPIPEQILNDLLRQEPTSQEFFASIAKAATDYTNARRILQDDGHPQMQRYLQRKQEAERALEAHRRGRLPELTQKYREKLAAESSVDLTKLRDDLASYEHQEVLLQAALDRVEADIRSLRPQNIPVELVALQNEIESYEQALRKANENIQIMRINSPTPRVSILQDAIEPGERDASRQMKLAGAGSIGMFLLTVLGVSFLEFRSRKIVSTDEVNRGLGLTVIGTVPTLPEKARSPIAQTKLDPYWQNQLMESIDTIRTMLLYNARSNNTRVIMVTSAVGGEGKTSLASQLAASLARAWKKTLLIDGDLRNPTSHKLFDIAQEPGLSEVLRGELSGSEAVRSTPLSRLWVLPAGHWDSHAVQALAQDNVRTMLEELKQQYDFIILDSCPILPVADSLLLGQNVDGVLLTVMRDVSRSPAVHAAHQRLESLGIKTLGAVVIGAKNELGPMGYKYAYQARP